MTKIKNYVVRISEELDGAKKYAEDYVMYKSKNDMVTANRYKEMANDELKHAMYIHDKAVKDIEELKKGGYNPTEKMRKKWDKSHARYVEQTANVKMMLSM